VTIVTRLFLVFVAAAIVVEKLRAKGLYR